MFGDLFRVGEDTSRPLRRTTFSLRGYHVKAVTKGVRHRSHRVVPLSLFAVALPTSTVFGQWSPDYHPYSIQRAGLYGPEQTGTNGYQESVPLLLNSGFVAGYSNRYTSSDNQYNRNSWLYNPASRTTLQLGLTGTVYTDSGGRQFSLPDFLNASGQVAGYSVRYTGTNATNGYSTWVYNPVTNATVQTGLTGAEQTGDGGRQYSFNQYQNEIGNVAGYSYRSPGADSPYVYGQNTWVYIRSTGTTRQIGFTGATFTGSTGYQYSEIRGQNAAGLVAGFSRLVSGTNSFNGTVAWLYNPASNMTRELGLTGAAYTGSAGYRSSGTSFLNNAGQVVGSSARILGVSTYNGENTWVYNPTTNTTVQTGLSGAAQTGITGYQSSRNDYQNEAGQVVGISYRYPSDNENRGQNTWVFSAVTNTTIITGLTGEAHTGNGGYQVSRNEFMLMNSGFVAGSSVRNPSLISSNGKNTWVYNPHTNSTEQTGLNGAAHTGIAGYQLSGNERMNANGYMAGYSLRNPSESGDNGRNTWIYNPTTNTTVQAGFTGTPYTGSAGYQYSRTDYLSSNGVLAGISTRITGLNTANGQDAWLYNTATGTTVQIGLTGAGYTGSAGYQFSATTAVNAAGQAVGYSRRVSGVNTSIGQDVWYYDPTSASTISIIASIRTSDNRAFSTPSTLTSDGFLLGTYLYYPGGIGVGEQHAFLFRPDLGLTDLGNLADGGLSASGWSYLQQPIFYDVLNTIVGYGYLNGQTSGRNVFVMTIPAPAVGVMLGFGGFFASRRRRG